MKKLTRAALLASLGLALVLPAPLLATDNQFINDYWMRTESSPAPARSASAVAPHQTASAPARSTVSPAPAVSAPAQGNLVPAVRGLPPDPGDGGTYRIVPGDVLKVQVFQVEELSSEERVNEQGEIVMPLIGPVTVGGLTPKAAETRIAAILSKDYLQDPQVDIYVTESSSQQVTVMGSVKKPGVFPIAGHTSLLQAIALAEGTDKLANEDEVIVFRPDQSGNLLAYVVDLNAIQKGELRDPVLVGNDRVVVPESGTAAFLKGVSDTLRGFVHIPLY
jgi:polysaccharide export outer membrane protein